ncbi:MAG: hypothetical protein JWR75_52 [Devosia sp.]|nr:hypothetical protein [Devosia sp.]
MLRAYGLLVVLRFSLRVRSALRSGLRLAALTLLFAAPLSGVGYAQDQGQVFAAAEPGFGRIILSFPGRTDLPTYKLKMENGVIALTFDAPVDIALPDLAALLPDYVSIARLDPDKLGLRLGLRTALNFNGMPAGEKLFIDLLPANWSGLPPALPSEVIAELTRRASAAAARAELERIAELAKQLKPQVELRVGRNPTFVRLQFNWTEDTEASFALEGQDGTLSFNWPVPVDLYEITANPPAELVAATNEVSIGGSTILLHVAPGVVPRFYADNPREFIVDIDVAGSAVPTTAAGVLAEAAAPGAEVAHGADEERPAGDVPLAEGEAAPDGHAVETALATLTPYAKEVGTTVRVVFPFEVDTAAAVFRRGSTIWMLLETPTSVVAPEASEALDSVVKDFVVTTSGDLQIVRMDLASDRLATLGSEGRAWVLSLGDALLTPTEPMDLNRRRDAKGQFEITADLGKPVAVHRFTDPIVGDTLEIITAYPPARGVVRTLDFVDFSALPSIHGLVIRPTTDDVAVAIESSLGVVSSQGGLIVSGLDEARMAQIHGDSALRGSFIDFRQWQEPDPIAFNQRVEALSGQLAVVEGIGRDKLRLDLAQFYASNRFSYEALGILKVMEGELQNPSLKPKLVLTQAIANVEAGRSNEALALLNSPALANEVDAGMWRVIARTAAGDFAGARSDALATESIIGDYPGWVRNAFALSAAEAAVETNDAVLAERYLGLVQFADMSLEESSRYQLLRGRAAEVAGRLDEAMDAYGQVIASDVRPTRAEAVYRTLELLDAEGKLDIAKATTTLAAEAMLWRGNALEADMQRLLADLYFRQDSFREGFEVVKAVSSVYPENAATTALTLIAERKFGELFLDGEADALSAIDALSLYYDFRELTPAGVQGDEMIRNLARRLVKVDLLGQAAGLLRYQIDSRLKGAARAQAAAELAAIEIANRDPQAALTALNDTRLAELPPTLERQRRLLEARALIDVGRDELAIDLLRDVTGREADYLRLDAHWKAGRFAEAAEMLETMYGGAPGPTDEAQRLDVIRAAVGFVLANDQLGLSRLRTKFGEVMSQSPQWPLFDFVTSSIDVAANPDFLRVAREVSGRDSLTAFLAAYRQTYSADLTPVLPTAPAVAG